MNWSVKGRLETYFLKFSQGIDIENGVVWILAFGALNPEKPSPQWDDKRTWTRDH